MDYAAGEVDASADLLADALLVQADAAERRGAVRVDLLFAQPLQCHRYNIWFLTA